MSQSSGNSPIDRVIAWFRGKLGGGSGTSATSSPSTTTPPAASSRTQEQVERANDAMRDTARDLGRPLEDDPAATTAQSGSATTQPGKPTQQQVETINDQLRENVRNLARPMETDTGDDLATSTDRPGDMGAEPDQPAGQGQPTGASSDEFVGGGYTPEPVTADDVERAAEGDGTPASDDAPGATSPPDTETGSHSAQGGTYAATAGEIATEGPSNETDLGLVDDGDLDATELGVLENAEESDLDAAARAVLERQREASSAGDASAGTSRFTDQPGADLSMTGFHAGGDEELSASGDDIATATGPITESSAEASTATDGSAGSPAIDLPASPASGDTSAIIRAGRDRQGADLSRTGLYAGIRGDDDASPGPVDEASTGSDAGGDSDTTDANIELASDLPNNEGSEKTPIVRVRADDGPGNTEMTAGDDYSAERAAEELPGAAVVSTTTADIGEQMASGEEADDLVGEPPVPDPAPGVAVAAEPTDVVATGSAGHEGSVRGDGTTNTPPGYPIKGNASSKIYHTPEMASYAATKPEWCFATAEDAERAGYRPPRPRHAASNA